MEIIPVDDSTRIDMPWSSSIVAIIGVIVS
jgi:hypothetical protein